MSDDEELATVLHKYSKPAVHHSYWQYGNTTKRSNWQPAVMFFCTALFLTTSIVFDVNNVCINYTQTLFDAELGLVIGSVVIYVIALGVYISYVHFCSIEQRNNHFWITIATSSGMAATISWLDVYAYTLNVYVAFAWIVMAMLTWVLGLAIFMEGHLRNCPDYNLHFISPKGNVESAMTALIVLFSITWLVYIFISLAYIEDLYIDTPLRNNSTCASNL